jgi:hypothetical protein
VQRLGIWWSFAIKLGCAVEMRMKGVKWWQGAPSPLPPLIGPGIDFEIDEGETRKTHVSNVVRLCRILYKYGLSIIRYYRNAWISLANWTTRYFSTFSEKKTNQSFSSRKHLEENYTSLILIEPVKTRTMAYPRSLLSILSISIFAWILILSSVLAAPLGTRPASSSHNLQEYPQSQSGRTLPKNIPPPLSGYGGRIRPEKPSKKNPNGHTT